MKNATGFETYQWRAEAHIAAVRRIRAFASVPACVTIWFFFFVIAPESFGQRITDSSNNTLNITLPFGTLTADASNNPSSVTVQFRLRGTNPAGYNVTVSSATFTPTTTDPVDGGDTITAADVGVGITSVTPAPGFSGVTPRADNITSGFDYDPSTVTATNGLTPYGGLSGNPARATLQDLISTSDTKILSGNRIHTNSQVTTGIPNYLVVTMTFGVIRQYFTPAVFTAVLNLVIENGQ